MASVASNPYGTDLSRLAMNNIAYQRYTARPDAQGRHRYIGLENASPTFMQRGIANNIGTDALGASSIQLTSRFYGIGTPQTFSPAGVNFTAIA